MAGETNGQPARWAIVELMGHRQTAGRISEVKVVGVAMLRIEVPAKRQPGPDGALQNAGWAGEQQYPGAALYGVHPCSEEQARRFLERLYSSPLLQLGPGESGAPRWAPGGDAEELLDEDDEEDDEQLAEETDAALAAEFEEKP